MKNCCTLFFKGTWNKCCCRHDRRYENRRLNRKQADILLKRCVKNSISNSTKRAIISNIMYAGVRLFGWIFYKRSSKMNMKLSKSNTFKAGALGFGAITGAVAYQEPITQILDGIFGEGTGDTLFTFLTGLIGLAGLFGVGKGRIEADHKPPLDRR